MGKVYNNLISTTAGFNYASEQPLDDREVVQKFTDLAELVSSNASYNGMRVYVVEDKKSYELVDGNWRIIATEEYVEQKLTEITVDAEDVRVNAEESLLNYIPIILTQEEYDTLVSGGTITLNGQPISYEPNRIYMIKRPIVDEEG